MGLVRQLAASSAEFITNHERDGSLTGGELERWLLDAGIARPNGAAGRRELTENGAELVALVAHLTER
jgi:hypothetical protein